jgi:hypothetical protein
MRAHWSSVSSWNRDTIPGFQNPTGKFIRHALAAVVVARLNEAKRSESACHRRTSDYLLESMRWYAVAAGASEYV